MSLDDEQALHLMRRALEYARTGLAGGGVPIGAVVADDSGRVLAGGHNESVQLGDHLLHAEMVALKATGRLGDYSATTLVTTMTPCWMCAGTVRFLGIGCVVVGDRTSWSDEPLEWLRSNGVDVRTPDDAQCASMFASWLADDPDAWTSLPSSVS